MLNSTNAKPKRSGLEDKMNAYFKLTFVVQLVITFVCALIYAILNSANFIYLGYLQQSPNFLSDMVSNWGTWFIIFASFVPISLLVTLELIRYFQGMKINADPFCKSKANDTSTSVQSSNLNEQLGQVNFLMSDKTGTLTKNVMNFRFTCVGGVRYGDEKTLSTEQLLNFPKVTNVEFADRNLFKHLTDRTHSNYQNLKQYMIHLSLCHCIIPQKNEYNASSPDELALANFAKFCSFTYLETTEDNFMVVEYEKSKHRYKLLHVLQFNSDRKRMSVIVRDQNNRIMLLCKGADSVLESRMVESQYKEATMLALQKYAVLGFRTLMLAQKTLTDQEYQEWDQRYQKALQNFTHDRHQNIELLQSQIERNMDMVGITAIQDKLQDNVYQTIKLLQKANIVVWMLTGDKKETAISIGHSAGLIQSDSQTIVLDCPPQNVEALLTNVELLLQVVSPNRTLILSGTTLLNLPQHLKSRIASLSMTCKSVICCRVSPKQKEYLVDMVKDHGRVLAIGDGANDVNMINKSHVGVGIKGHEGSQAARAADYVIGEFQILRELILFHGREIYRRNSNVIIFNIFKNMIIIMPIVWFAFVSMFSGSYMYENWIFQFYNTLFTFLPIMIYSLFDCQYSREQSIATPELYKIGHTNHYLNNNVFIMNVVVCLYESTVLSVLVFGFCTPSLVSSHHMMFEISTGMILFTLIVIICNIRPLLFAYSVNLLFIVASGLGILLYFTVYISVSYLIYTQARNTLYEIMSTGQFWILLVLGIPASEGVYLMVSRYQEFNQDTEDKETLLDKSNQAEVQMMETTNRRHLQELDKITSEIFQQSRKAYTGYAFDEDQSRENK